MSPHQAYQTPNVRQHAWLMGRCPRSGAVNTDRQLLSANGPALLISSTFSDVENCQTMVGEERVAVQFNKSPLSQRNRQATINAPQPNRRSA